MRTHEFVPIGSGTDQRVTSRFTGENRIELSHETRGQLRRADPRTDPWDLTERVGNLYEEAAHAWLRTHDELTNSTLWQAALRHYQGAPLEDGSTSTNTRRLAHEAIGTYVNHRVTTWWNAYQELAQLHTIEDPAARATQLRSIVEQYNRDMSFRVFGYEPVSPAGCGAVSTQVDTTRAITDQLRGYADQEILEGRIHDRFEDDTLFADFVRGAYVPAAAPSEASDAPSQPQPSGPGEVEAN
jgi:hypothetical protein